MLSCRRAVVAPSGEPDCAGLHRADGSRLQPRPGERSQRHRDPRSRLRHSSAGPSPAAGVESCCAAPRRRGGNLPHIQSGTVGSTPGHPSHGHGAPRDLETPESLHETRHRSPTCDANAVQQASSGIVRERATQRSARVLKQGDKARRCRSDDCQSSPSSGATALDHRAPASAGHSLQESMLPLTRYSLRLIRAFRHQFPHHITGHTDPSDGERRTSSSQYTPARGHSCVDWTAQLSGSLRWLAAVAHSCGSLWLFRALQRSVDRQ